MPPIGPSVVAGGTAPAGAAPAAGRRPKGPRPKHGPRRMCVACRRHDAKRRLIRVVRTPEGEVALDPTGKRNGRGAYLCHRPDCWERALATGILGKALKTTIDEAANAALRRHAASLRPADEAAAHEGER